MSPGITAVICSFNGEDLLPSALKRIFGQKLEARYQARVVIVDNNSTDSTRETAIRIAENAPIPVEVFCESRQGKSFALEKAMESVRTDLVAIIDDDNLVPDGYFQEVCNRFEREPLLGFLGIATELLSDEPPPWWWNSQSSMFAVGTQAAKSGYLDETGKPSVWGAGMVFRCKMWKECYSHYQSSLTGRNESNLVAGEDTEFCLLASLLGYRGYIDNSIVVGHFMKKERLTVEYLYRLRWALGYGSIQNKSLHEEWAIRQSRIKPFQLFLRRSKLFLIVYYLVRIYLYQIMTLLILGKRKVLLKADCAAFRGCLAAVKNTSRRRLWSFPFGVRRPIEVAE